MQNEINTLLQHIVEKNHKILELEKLVEQLQNVKPFTDETCLITDEEDQKYYELKEDTNIKQSLTPFIKGQLTKTNTWFITITFSSKRFRLTPASVDDQRKYILLKLMNAYQLGLINSCYGTMELFKSGIVHSHLICQTYQIKLFQQYLNEEFNHSQKNIHCIDIKPAHVSSALKYVNKEDENGKERGNLFYSLGDIKLMLDISIK